MSYLSLDTAKTQPEWAGVARAGRSDFQSARILRLRGVAPFLALYPDAPGLPARTAFVLLASSIVFAFRRATRSSSRVGCHQPLSSSPASGDLRAGHVRISSSTVGDRQKTQTSSPLTRWPGYRVAITSNSANSPSLPVTTTTPFAVATGLPGGGSCELAKGRRLRRRSSSSFLISAKSGDRFSSSRRRFRTLGRQP